VIFVNLKKQHFQPKNSKNRPIIVKIQLKTSILVKKQKICQPKV